ncbi:VWA domain-containing protein [Methylobacillus caricis]|uniref:vWA domain-containing protein n=1 Tax=Methylobacillus caricis TaxID=1971611 RepID=UPI001CFFD85E|nr:vWA domain-containing protein [Methylobacillus caricis]MCB5186863.1 VWA domain-containing protein [Methylobacillus caricis]
MKYPVHKALDWARSHYETLLIGLAMLLLAASLVKPQVMLKQEVHNFLLLADVSQSMNAQDLKLKNKTVSRMEYTQHLMKRIVETSSCGTYISLGAYSAENVALLFMPLEVCANYDEIMDSISQLEWRMAWSGNSRITFGVKAAEEVLDYLDTPAKMLFFTDGDEAPKANGINKLDLSDVRIGKRVMFVGIGGKEAVPIPRYNANNKWVGYWGIDSKEEGGGGGNYADASKDDPDPVVASAEYDRYLSSLDAEHLQEVAREIDGQYIEGSDSDEFLAFVQKQKPAARILSIYSLTWIYYGLAFLCILGIYLPNFWRTGGRLKIS